MGLPYSRRGKAQRKMVLMWNMCFEENNRVGVAGEQKQKPEVCGAEPERTKQPCWKGTLSTGGCWGISWKSQGVWSSQAWPQEVLILKALALLLSSQSPNQSWGVGWALRADYSQTPFRRLTPWLLPSPSPKIVWLSSFCHLGL